MDRGSFFEGGPDADAGDVVQEREEEGAPARLPAEEHPLRHAAHRGVEGASFSSVKARQTLQSSFSAASKPNFASKYSLESSRRDLHSAFLCTALQSQLFVEKFPTCLLIFSKI